VAFKVQIFCFGRKNQETTQDGLLSTPHITLKNAQEKIASSFSYVCSIYLGNKNSQFPLSPSVN